MNIILLIASIFIPGLAQAYLDPGTGSMILQIILAALLGALFTIKTFWMKITVFFKSLGGTSKKSDACDTPEKLDKDDKS